MRILVVASYPMEFPGILKHATDPRKVKDARKGNGALRWARSARVGANELLLAANGTGRRHASNAVDRALKMFPAEAVISTGFCGALRPEMEVADVVIGTAVVSGDQHYATWPVSAPASLGRIHRGVICTVDHVVETAGEKRSLQAEGGAAVEMEAAGVAERASAYGLPFSCVKAVTDLLAETLTNDFNRALREDGDFDTIVLLQGALRHPLVRIRELFRLRERCARAAGMLGEFFADLRF